MKLLISLLWLLFYAVCAVGVLELIFLIIRQFIEVPAKLRQVAYALVGILFIIYIVTIIAASGFPSLPGPHGR